jgi:hypothetical protein
MAALAAPIEHHALETAVQLRQFLLLHQESKPGVKKKAVRTPA